MIKESKQVPRKTKLKPKYPLPHMRISVEKQLEVLKGYVVASDRGKKSVGYKDVGPLVSINEIDVSSCNKFFQDAKLIEFVEKGKYTPSQNVIKYIDKLDYNENEGKSFLRKSIEDTWFGKLTTKMFRLSKEISKEKLVNALGSFVGGEKTENKRALEMLIEYMEYVNLIEANEKDQICLVREISEIKEKMEEITSEGEEKAMADERVPSTSIVPTISINIQLDTSNWSVNDVKELIGILRGQKEQQEEK